MSGLLIRSDGLQVTVLPRGAALVGVRFADCSRNLVLGFADPADHARLPVFAGHLAGPVANRVRGGLVRIGGKTYRMRLNEAGRTCLHSGPDGLHAQDWEVLAHEGSSLTLATTLCDGQSGLPGNRQFEARYTVSDKMLTLRITATTDAATPINVAAHPYWNLDGARDVSGHHLTVAADSYLTTDAHNLPKGEIASVAGTPLDFRDPSFVPCDTVLDTNFCLARAMRLAPVLAATLVGADGTTLAIATTTPGLQVYNGAFLPRDAVKMADGPPLAPFAGIALEPQHWPDAPHHGHFPQITIAPDEIYLQITEYRLSQAH